MSRGSPDEGYPGSQQAPMATLFSSESSSCFYQNPNASIGSVSLEPEGSDYGVLQLLSIVMVPVSSQVMDIFSQFITVFIITALTAMCHTMQFA